MFWRPERVRYNILKKEGGPSVVWLKALPVADMTKNSVV